ncbi:MAG: DNA cytosine methyltransferase [Christensenellales bacterium]
MPKVIDLFAGAGGLSLGAARAGFEISAAVELDSNAILTHAKNFPGTIHIQEDIEYLTSDRLLKLSKIMPGDIFGIIGGPPCQGFSNIGLRQHDDNRNQLFLKFFNMVNEIQPVFFLAENVPGIMDKRYDSIRHSAFALMKGYQLLPPIHVNASEYGAPTTRTRVFFVGYRKVSKTKRLCVNDILFQKVPLSYRTNVLQAFEGLPQKIQYSKTSSGARKLREDYTNSQIQHSQSDFFYNRVLRKRPVDVGSPSYLKDFDKEFWVNGFLPTKHSEDVKKRYGKLKFGQQDTVSKSVRLDPSGYCPTLRAGTGPDRGSYQAVRPIHFKYSRVINPREAARLQGFPDWFELPDTIWHSFRQIGNSVSPIVAERILTAIYQNLT